MVLTFIKAAILKMEDVLLIIFLRTPTYLLRISYLVENAENSKLDNNHLHITPLGRYYKSTKYIITSLIFNQRSHLIFPIPNSELNDECIAKSSGG